MRTSEPPPSPWEIWHARFNFDRHGYKFRPVLVLSRAPSGLLAAMITSASNKLALPHDTPIEDWEQAGLATPSLVRVDRIAMLPTPHLGTAGRIGRLSLHDAHGIEGTLGVAQYANEARFYIILPRPRTTSRDEAGASQSVRPWERVTSRRSRGNGSN